MILKVKYVKINGNYMVIRRDALKLFHMMMVAQTKLETVYQTEFNCP